MNNRVSICPEIFGCVCNVIMAGIFMNMCVMEIMEENIPYIPSERNSALNRQYFFVKSYSHRFFFFFFFIFQKKMKFLLFVALASVATSRGQELPGKLVCLRSLHKNGHTKLVKY